MEELENINKKSEEIKKRMLERQRLMTLLKNKNTKNTSHAIDIFKKNQSIKLIQRAYRKHKTRQEQKKQIALEKQNAKYKFNQDIENTKKGLNLDMVLNVIKIQKKFRQHLLEKNHSEIRQKYIRKYVEDYLQPVSYTRGVELRKELLHKLKISRNINPENYNDIMNDYFNSYKEFCFSYDYMQQLRESNFGLYHQNYDMLKYMEAIDLNKMDYADQRFKVFMLNKNKVPVIKKKVDQMEYNYTHNTMFVDDIDDLEERNILDEIDNMYNYERWENILKGKY